MAIVLLGVVLYCDECTFIFIRCLTQWAEAPCPVTVVHRILSRELVLFTLTAELL